MVERSKSTGFDEFVGKIVEIKVEPSSNPQIEGEQYHIQMKPDDKTLTEGSKTGNFHEWIRIPPKATDTSVPEGSVLDKFLLEIEFLHKEVKKLESHVEVMNFIVGKKYLFKKKVLGKSFQGHEAKPYWIPAREL